MDYEVKFGVNVNRFFETRYRIDHYDKLTELEQHEVKNLLKGRDFHDLFDQSVK